jgi:dolichol-phosphate mannosyltransferase
MKSVTVVICAYNEEKNLKKVMDETIQVLISMAIDFELIVVDDGSRDGTLNVVRQMASKDAHIKTIVHEQNQGIGRALLDGYGQAQKDLVTFLPADGQISPQDVKMLAESMGDYDMVVSYYIQRPVSIFRQLTSKGVRVILFLLFGTIPRYEGTYMFNRQILKDITLKMHTSFVLNYELVIRAYRQGFKIKEVPTKCLERTSGSSKVLGLKKILFVFSQILELRFKYFP